MITPANINTLKQTLGSAAPATAVRTMEDLAVGIARLLEARAAEFDRIVGIEAQGAALGYPVNLVRLGNERWSAKANDGRILADHKLLVDIYKPFVAWGAPAVDERPPELVEPPVPTKGAGAPLTKYGPGFPQPAQNPATRPPVSRQPAAPTGRADAQTLPTVEVPAAPTFTATRDVMRSELAEVERRLRAGETPAAVFASLGVVPKGAAPASEAPAPAPTQAGPYGGSWRGDLPAAIARVDQLARDFHKQLAPAARDALARRLAAGELEVGIRRAVAAA